MNTIQIQENITTTAAAAAKQIYSGWPNRQTWNVMLWMENKQPYYRAYVGMVRRYKTAGKRFGNAAARQICLDCLGEKTPDNIKVTGTAIRWSAIAKAMRESE